MQGFKSKYIKPKTANYLNTEANEAEKLLAKAIEIRRNYDNAQTAIAKEIYRKKLVKIIRHLNSKMQLFQDLERIKNLQEPPETEAVK